MAELNLNESLIPSNKSLINVYVAFDVIKTGLGLHFILNRQLV